MKALLAGIKTRLKDQVSAVRSRDIFLMPEADFVPEYVKMPCIGIKDGAVTRTDLAYGLTELSLPVAVSVYVRLLKDEAAIWELLEIAAAVTEALDGELLEDYVKDVSCGDETPVRVLLRDDGLVIAKTLQFTYLKEV